MITFCKILGKIFSSSSTVSTYSLGHVLMMTRRTTTFTRVSLCTSETLHGSHSASHFAPQTRSRGFSFFYYVFFESQPPGKENDGTAAAEALLNTIALVAALVLTVAMALPTTVTFDELVAADARQVEVSSQGVSLPLFL